MGRVKAAPPSTTRMRVASGWSLNSHDHGFHVLAPDYPGFGNSDIPPHAVRVNLDLFNDYRTNPPLYPRWQAFLRERQPKTLIFWGQGDPFFTPAGGEAYLRDLPGAELHRLDAGHFAVEDHLAHIAGTMKQFYDTHVRPAAGQTRSRSAPDGAPRDPE